MSPSSSPSRSLSPRIGALLRGLRRRIRIYLWLEGLSVFLGVLGLVFWISLGMDWLFELPLAMRLVLLVGGGCGVVVLLYQRVLRRALVQLRDRSMAVLLERRFDQFRDSLLTVVEMDQRPESAAACDVRMLAATEQRALEASRSLRLGKVLDARPLVRRIGFGLLLTASVIAFGVTGREAFGIWARRNLMLSTEAWPRKTHLLVDGFDTHGRRKVARGSDALLVVRAEVGIDRLVPERVELRRLDSGAGRRTTMTREGNAVRGRDDFQRYIHTFRGLLEDVRFEARGGDDRSGPWHLQVVDSPTLHRMVLHCRYPEYLGRAPREVPVSGVMQVPAGTHVTVRAQANKPIVEARIEEVVADGESTMQVLKLADRVAADREDHLLAIDPDRAETASPTPSADEDGNANSSGGQVEFSFDLGTVDADKLLLISLLDHDGIASRRPVRLTIGAVPDEPPQLQVRLQGIGTAITQQARIPLIGKLTDDYGLARASFVYHINDAAWQRSDFFTGSPTVELVVDAAFDARQLQLVPQQKLHLAVEAEDNCALEEHPNIGTSRPYLLDVVTPAELRMLLESRELLLRQRFETIIEELTATRDLLATTAFAPDGGTRENGESDSAEPAADAANSDGPAGGDRTLPERDAADRAIRLARIRQNSQRSAHEIEAVAVDFGDIRDQLVNNRVDTAELLSRLEGGVLEPLGRISSEMFPELESRLEKLEGASDATRENARDAAVQQADVILVAMQKVLTSMLELESFNEVLDLLRDIIKSQEELNERTRQQQKDKLRRLLED